jgi:AcrR family transcriptional regulator
MPRTHGWDGRPPESDEEAIDRILEATQRCIRRNAAKASINEVALELGVTRPTVYRYFASTDALLTAATIQAAGAFLERVLARMAPFDDPVEAIIESIAFTVEELPLDCNMASLLAAGRLGRPRWLSAGSPPSGFDRNGRVVACRNQPLNS